MPVLYISRGCRLPALHKGERGCSLFRPAPNQGAWPTFIDSTPEHDPPLDRAITVCLRVMSLTWPLYCLPVTFLTGYTNCTVDPSVSFRSLGLCGNADHISIFLSFQKRWAKASPRTNGSLRSVRPQHQRAPARQTSQAT